MFRFSGRLNRPRFLTGATIRVVLFVATVIGFPYILFGVAKATSCAGVGGACGAVALVASTVLKPLFFFLFVFSLVGISLRRTRDAGLPGALGLLIPALVAGDYGFGVFAGAHWSFAFSQGVLGLSFPWYMTIALALIVVLGLLPPRDPPPYADAPASAPAGRWAQTSAGKWVSAWTGRLPPLPKWILPTAALLTAGALIANQYVLFTQSPVTGLIFLAVSLVPTGLPTFVIYSAAFYGIYCIYRQRNPLTTAVLVVTLLPFGLWLYAAISTPLARQQEASTIAAVKTERLDHVPNVLVFRSQNMNGLFDLLGLHGITEIIADGANGTTSGLVSYTGRRNASGMMDMPKVDKLPEEYLLLNVGRKSAFAGKPNSHAMGGGPLELRRVAPGRDDLIAVWYRTYRPSPAFPPVLTTSGWAGNHNFVAAASANLSIKAFLDQSIDNAKTPPRRAGLN